MTGIVAHTYPEWWLKLTGQAAHWSTDYSTELQKTYKSAEKEVADLNRKLANIKQYLHQEQTPERAETKKPEQSL